MIKAQIIADSITKRGNRLTTFVLEFPRFILAELNTHRMLSKNTASSRAIPTIKMIEMVSSNPVFPVEWGKNQPGMQAGESLSEDKIILSYYSNEGIFLNIPVYVSETESAKRIWLNARNNAINSAKELYELGVHKQIVNRILEPWLLCRSIVSGTEWGNFFALRAHTDAQPEIRELAYKMLDEYNDSKPQLLEYGKWHIPFGDKISEERIRELPIIKKENNIEKISNLIEECKLKIAIARCARVSYYNFEGKDDYQKDLDTCNKLFGSVPRHLSPTEHVAVAIDSDEFLGNYKGWKQYRKFFNDENLTDPRIKPL